MQAVLAKINQAGLVATARGVSKIYFELHVVHIALQFHTLKSHT
jgi:hypothetical protein